MSTCPSRRRRTQVTLLLLVATFLAACPRPYLNPVVEPQEAPFPGITTALDGANDIDLVLIHGMCTHDGLWAWRTNEQLARVLELRHQQTESVPLAPHGELFKGTLSSSTKTVRTYAVLWSPISQEAKAQLCYDASAETALCEGEFRPPRAKKNGEIKSELMDDCLADAVYYSGAAGGQAIRSAVKQALREVGRESRGVPLFVSAESLGSKVVADSLVEMLLGEGKAPSSVAEEQRRVAAALTANLSPRTQSPRWLRDSRSRPQQRTRHERPA